MAPVRATRSTLTLGLAAVALCLALVAASEGLDAGSDMLFSDTCDARGRELRYRITGSPEDRHAARIHLGAISVADPHPDGLQLDVIKGRWSGGDTLAMSAGFYWRRGASGIGSTDDPATQDVPLTMTRGTVEGYRALCRRLAARRRAAQRETRSG